MEFPGLGSHCSSSTCKQLDFLPMKCDACEKIFCNEHFSYNDHNCPEAYKKDNQVPVCPLCNKPIPVKRGEPPDLKVSQHIDTDCQSDPAKEKRKIYTNRCKHKGCKTKELIPFHCDNCQKNFCIKHRLETDHDCQGYENSGQGMSRAGAAAVSRFGQSSSKPNSAKSKPKAPQQTTLTNMGWDLDRQRRERAQAPPQARNLRGMQAGMTEDEAMAAAIAASLQGSDQANQPPQGSLNQQEQEDADLALARALAASEEEASRPPTNARRVRCF